MATRSTIGIVNADSTITSIYCHWDGYPENNGEILVKHYTDPAKIQQLMALGALSSLGEEIGEQHDFNSNSQRYCTAYGRDRGESNVSATTHHSLFYFLNNGEEFNYLFCDGKWNCYAGNDKNAIVDLYEIEGA
jgi:hypothetical protein